MMHSMQPPSSWEVTLDSGNGNGPTTKKGKKGDAATKATRPDGKKFGLTALEAFARAEAKTISALAEAIARREEMQRAVDQGKDVSQLPCTQALLEERRRQAQHQAKPGVLYEGPGTSACWQSLLLLSFSFSWRL
jgi:hypothetical protein